jgi:hypothetical protein
MNRPTSVSVVAWILVVTSGISLFASTLALNNPMGRELMAYNLLPIPVQFALLYAGILFTVVAGIAMLKGMNWGRFLYVIWSIVGFLVGFTTSPLKAAMIPSLVVFGIFTFFLFRPKAEAYFSGKGIANDAQSI